MTTDDTFPQQLAAMRPALHRYCARMTGSTVDGDDVVQEVLIKAFAAQARDPQIDNLRAWLFRIAQNASLDFLRGRARSNVVPLTDDILAETDSSEPDIANISFRTFQELPTLQRCAVILKDVLGHSVEEIATITDSTAGAVKSALQRGRQKLRGLAADGWNAPQIALMNDIERRQLDSIVSAFKSSDFNRVRQILAEEVRLDLVNHSTRVGRKSVEPYFTGYEDNRHWLFALGVVDGQPAILVFDSRTNSDRPAHFVVIAWRDGTITAIKDFLFAPYAMETNDWLILPDTVPSGTPPRSLDADDSPL
jgi:RNA polymerase sigma factor (sigma-70 family)